MATIRSREISACLVLQAQSQLKSLYKDNADTIVGNCDSAIFLGGKEKTTLEDWSKLLGKETIDSYNTSETKGNSPSYGKNYQKLGKDVLPCKSVESTTLILHGSSFICGTDGRTQKTFSQQEHFTPIHDVIKCGGKCVYKLFTKRSSDLPPVFSIYIEGRNLNTVVIGYSKPTQKGGQIRNNPFVSSKIRVYQTKSK